MPPGELVETVGGTVEVWLGVVGAAAAALGLEECGRGRFGGGGGCFGMGTRLVGHPFQVVAPFVAIAVGGRGVRALLHAQHNLHECF